MHPFLPTPATLPPSIQRGCAFIAHPLESLFAPSSALRFSPDGCDLWCVERSGEASVWRDSDGQGQLKHSELTVSVEHPPEGYPWGSIHGYRVTSDWWILGPDGKRLLLLPPPWQPYAVHRVWGGQFLALLHGATGLSEPVILGLDVNRDR